MLQFKYLLLFLVVLATSECFPAQLERSDFTEWDKNKLEILTNTVEAILSNTGNGVIIVASQNIYNDDGTIKEIKTIELGVPNLFHGGFRRNNKYADYIEKLKENDEEIGDTIKKIQEDFKATFDHTHLDKETAYLKQANNGEVELEIYVNRNEVFYQDDEGMGYHLRDNIFKPDKKALEEELKKRFQDSNNTMLSVLVWDEDRKFVSNESRVEPNLLVFVNKASVNADEKMMDSAMAALAKYVLNYPDRVAKELSAAMSNAHPEYTWLVTKWQEEQADNAKHDVFIKMTYDNVEVGEAPLEYTVYGVMK